ncbi:MAG: hypothetical protein RIR00_319 [Pseudomonadota bacterium]|jgi:type IV pilus assembly protein PilN
MIRINLLPYREEARKARRQQFYVLLGAVTLLAGLIVFVVSSVISGYISSQEAKNAFLQGEITKLDKDIAEIKRLKEQTQALLSRKQVIESLQQDRGETVRLLSELVTQVPSGVYLRSLKQDGTKVSLTGYAQSNARVSNLMRNLEESPWLEAPNLLETKSVIVDKRRLYEFALDVTLTRIKPDATAKEGK